jgi:hypothetical protein
VPVESYIVRIYRRDEDSQRGLLGQVVDIQTDKESVFSNMDDLMKILCSQDKIPGKGDKEK